MKPSVIGSIQDWQELRKSPVFADKSVGFVATMGSLHAGHESLLARSRSENEISVLSIFVNPTQFDQASDLENYPRTLDADLAVAERNEVDFVFAPVDPKEMYPDQYRFKVSETELSQSLCGKHRPGHFDGVLSVVMKLFQLIRPQRTYWGEKDYQQLLLIQGMVEAFFMDIQVLPCPIVREADGLAMSSRNARIRPEEREKAGLFPKYLSIRLPPAQISRKLKELGFEVEYIEERGNRRFGAVKLGDVRLIDNTEVP